jgi:hypothetical protein
VVCVGLLLRTYRAATITSERIDRSMRRHSSKLHSFSVKGIDRPEAMAEIAD